MPLYNYKCPKCGNTDTRLKKLTENCEVDVCSKCGAESTKQISAPSAFVFNGSPFSASTQR